LIYYPGATEYNLGDAEICFVAFIQDVASALYHLFKRLYQIVSAIEFCLQSCDVEKLRAQLETFIAIFFIDRERIWIQNDSSERRVKTSQPSLLTTMVCSHCAESLRSLVVTVQPSFLDSLV